MALRCEHTACPAQQARAIEYFAARTALNIEGLGEVVADKLVERGLARSPLDLLEVARNAGFEADLDGLRLDVMRVE